MAEVKRARSPARTESFATVERGCAAVSARRRRDLTWICSRHSPKTWPPKLSNCCCSECERARVTRRAIATGELLRLARWRIAVARSAEGISRNNTVVRRDKLAEYRRKIKSPACRREYAALESGKRPQHCSPFISLFSFTWLDPQLYNSRVIFDRAFLRLFCTLQKLIAENVVAYVYLYIALSKSRLMSNVSALQHSCRHRCTNSLINLS